MITATVMQLKDKLKEIRALKEWSQQQFADKLDEKRSTYAEWEKGTIPSFDIVVKISAITGVSILEFVALFDKKVAKNAISAGFSATNDVHLLPEDNEGMKDGVYLIEVKSASGKQLSVHPDRESEVNILNAFLEERDRVIEVKNERINELSNDKTELFKLLNSGIADLSKVQKATFAMVRTGLEYKAAVASQGDKKKEAELLGSLTKLNHKNLKIDTVAEKAVVLSK